MPSARDLKAIWYMRSSIRSSANDAQKSMSHCARRKGKNATRAMSDDTMASATDNSERYLSVRYAHAPRAILMASCRAKNRKTPAEALFHCSASSKRPLTISENAWERPHEG